MAPKQVSSDVDVNDSATSEEFHSDSTQSVKKIPLAATNSRYSIYKKKLFLNFLFTSIMLAINDLELSLQEHGDRITQLQKNISRLLELNRNVRNAPSYLEVIIVIFLLGLFQAVLVYYF